MTPETTLIPDVVRAMKIPKTSYNEDANQFMKQAKHDKDLHKNLNFLINLVTVVMVTEIN